MFDFLVAVLWNSFYFHHNSTPRTLVLWMRPIPLICSTAYCTKFTLILCQYFFAVLAIKCQTRTEVTREKRRVKLSRVSAKWWVFECELVSMKSIELCLQWTLAVYRQTTWFLLRNSRFKISRRGTETFDKLKFIATMKIVSTKYDVH